MGIDSSNPLYGLSLAQMDALITYWYDKISNSYAIPILRKVGTVADTYNPITGEYIQRIKAVTLNGTENWQDGYFPPTVYKQFVLTNWGTINGILDSNQGAVKTMCDRFPAGYVNLNINGHTIAPHLYINIEPALAANIAAFKAWLALNNTTIYSILATPVTTNLTPITIPTNPPYMMLTTDSTVKADITATLKVQD